MSFTLAAHTKQWHVYLIPIVPLMHVFVEGEHQGFVALFKSAINGCKSHQQRLTAPNNHMAAWV